MRIQTERSLSAVVVEKNKGEGGVNPATAAGRNDLGAKRPKEKGRGRGGGVRKNGGGSSGVRRNNREACFDNKARIRYLLASGLTLPAVHRKLTKEGVVTSQYPSFFRMWKQISQSGERGGDVASGSERPSDRRQGRAGDEEIDPRELGLV